MCSLASQVISLSRALFCIRRVHLRDLLVRRGGGVRRGLVPSAPLLGTSHSSSGWRGTTVAAVALAVVVVVVVPGAALAATATTVVVQFVVELVMVVSWGALQFLF